MKYIYHHLGLGDHIICNGLVRTLINDDEEYTIFVKEQNLTSVKFMYNDLTNLNYLVGDDFFVNTYITKNNIIIDDLIIAGFYRHPESKEFDDSFYLQNNLNFNLRWDNFKINRDLEKEIELFNKYNVTKNNYVFIHDDHSRNLHINENFIVNKQLPIIRPIKGLTDNIFDYMYLLENSVECHFMDSSFRLMYDSLGSQKDYLYYHITYNEIKRDITKSHSKLKYVII